MNTQSNQGATNLNEGTLPVRRSARFKMCAGLIVAMVALTGLEGLARLVLPASAGLRFSQINQIVVFLGTQESDLMLDYDQDRFWKLKPGITIDDSNNVFWQGTVSNSLGFRSPEFSLQRSPDTLRVVCFGDSSTFGIGSTMQDTWPSQLKSIIEDDYRFMEVGDVEVINAGVPGYTSYQGLQHMRQEIDRLKPDLVMASYANNDFWHWDQTTDEDHAKALGKSDGLSLLISNSRLVQGMAMALQKLNAGRSQADVSTASPNQHWAAAATMNYVSPVDEWTRRVPLDSFKSNVSQMADLCDQRDVPLVLVRWPDQPQAAGQWSPRIEYQDVLAEIAVSRGLYVADVVAMFQANRSWSVNTYIPNDIVHVNKDGNRLAAMAAFDGLCKALLLNDERPELTN